MDKGKTSKFFKAYANNHTYKVFLEDVSVIYKFSMRKTPTLCPYLEEEKMIQEETDDSCQGSSELVLPSLPYY